MQDCTSKNCYKMPDGIILEDFYTTNNDRTASNIADAMVMMFETFKKDHECKQDNPKFLKSQSEIDARLAQLGIDRKFELEKGDNSVTYHSHLFAFCECKTGKSNKPNEPECDVVSEASEDSELE